MEHVIGGYVKRGGRRVRAHWTGRAWSRTKGMIYPTAAAARKAADAIDVTNVDSIAIYEAPPGCHHARSADYARAGESFLRCAVCERPRS
jgi:hypothetical protein